MGAAQDGRGGQAPVVKGQAEQRVRAPTPSVVVVAQGEQHAPVQPPLLVGGLQLTVPLLGFKRSALGILHHGLQGLRLRFHLVPFCRCCCQLIRGVDEAPLFVSDSPETSRNLGNRDKYREYQIFNDDIC